MSRDLVESLAVPGMDRPLQPDAPHPLSHRSRRISHRREQARIPSWHLWHLWDPTKLVGVSSLGRLFRQDQVTRLLSFGR